MACQPTRRFALLSILLLVAAASPGIRAEAESNDLGEPAGVVASFEQLLASGDQDGALALLAPDVLIYEAGGAELSREEYASHHMKGDMAFVAATEHAITDQVSGRDAETAWVLTRSTTRGTYGDREIDLLGTETMLLKKKGDSWQIFHIHWSSRSRKSSH